MLKRGWSYADIGRRYGLSRVAVRNYVLRYVIGDQEPLRPPPPPKPPPKAKAFKPPPKPKRKPLTDRQIATMRQLWAAGFTAREIAQQIGHKQSRVESAVWRLRQQKGWFPTRWHNPFKGR